MTNSKGYKLEIIPRMYKYNKPKEVQHIIFLTDVKLEQNYFTTMHVIYEDDTSAFLEGRVTLNEIKNSWAIDAINSKGDQLALRILE